MKDNIRSIVKTGLVLFAIGFICTFILAVCNDMTKDTIAKLNAETERAAMTATLGDARVFDKIHNLSSDVVTDVYKGKDDSGNTVGYCVKATPIGYGGEISMIVGISSDCKVTGVDIVSMSETPGLGAKADDESFYNQYIGKSATVGVKKSGTPAANEISAISGATLTSKAVTEGINAALEIVRELR